MNVDCTQTTVPYPGFGIWHMMSNFGPIVKCLTPLTLFLGLLLCDRDHSSHWMKIGSHTDKIRLQPTTSNHHLLHLFPPLPLFACLLNLLLQGRPVIWVMCVCECFLCGNVKNEFQPNCGVVDTCSLLTIDWFLSFFSCPPFFAFQRNFYCVKSLLCTHTCSQFTNLT